MDIKDAPMWSLLRAKCGCHWQRVPAPPFTDMDPGHLAAPWVLTITPGAGCIDLVSKEIHGRPIDTAIMGWAYKGEVTLIAQAVPFLPEQWHKVGYFHLLPLSKRYNADVWAELDGAEFAEYHVKGRKVVQSGAILDVRHFDDPSTAWRRVVVQVAWRSGRTAILCSLPENT